MMYFDKHQEYYDAKLAIFEEYIYSHGEEVLGDTQPVKPKKKRKEL